MKEGIDYCPICEEDVPEADSLNCAQCDFKLKVLQNKASHRWELGWEESEKPHPGFGGSMDIYGGYVDQCEVCGMFFYEFLGPNAKYEFQKCGEKIR